MNGFKEVVEHKHSNSYYINNSELFDRILFIIENSKSIIAAKNSINADQQLMNYIDSVVPMLSKYSLYTKLNWILHDIHDFPRCQYCNHILPKIEIAVFKVYSSWCSLVHRNKDPRFKKYCGDKLEQKYGKGVRSNFQIPGMKSKIKKTWKKKYGTENPFQLDEIKNKKKQTFIEHYGVDNNMKSEAGMNAYRKSMRQKYGVDYTWQLSSTIEKAKQTSYQHFGVYITSQSQQAKDKQEKTNIERYGCKSALQNEECKKKSEQTCLKKYGVKHQAQSKEVRAKMRQKYCFENETFDSSWELAFWIYHLDNNIQIEHEPLFFEYVDSKQKLHRYYPDFRVGDQLIEIKGDDQFDESGRMIDKLNRDRDYIAEAKHQCMIQNNVMILKGKDIKQYLDYIDQKYGNNYLRQFKRKHEDEKKDNQIQES